MHWIASQRTSITNIFPEEHAPETPQKSAPFAVLMGAILPILPQCNKSLGPLYHKILRPSLNTKWSTVQSCCPFRTKTENYWRNSLTIIWDSISFIEFNQKSIQNDGSTLLGRPFNLLVAKLRVNLRGSTNRLWSNLIAIRVDTQLKNGFGVQLLSRQRVLKTTELQEQYKKHVTTSRDVVYLIWVILVSKLFLWCISLKSRPVATLINDQDLTILLPRVKKCWGSSSWDILCKTGIIERNVSRLNCDKPKLVYSYFKDWRSSGALRFRFSNGFSNQNNNFALASRFFVHFSAVTARLRR